jgi:hypothetical protein
LGDPGQAIFCTNPELEVRFSTASIILAVWYAPWNMRIVVVGSTPGGREKKSFRYSKLSISIAYRGRCLLQVTSYFFFLNEGLRNFEKNYGPTIQHGPEQFTPSYAYKGRRVIKAEMAATFPILIQ